LLPYRPDPTTTEQRKPPSVTPYICVKRRHSDFREIQPEIRASSHPPKRCTPSHGLSATQHGDRILLAWKGMEEDPGIYFSLFDGNEFTGQIRVGAVGTTQGPGVCRIGTTTHMAWKGLEGDSVIYWSTL